MMDKKQQLSFFSAPTDEIQNPTECSASNDSTLKVYIDGAARNNPGPAGAGVCIFQEGSLVLEQGFFLGKKTNNQAEYLGLVIALLLVRQYASKKDVILIHSDSQLLVRQMTGVYKVRDLFLKKIQQVIIELSKDYRIVYCHVYREQNTHADTMANRGIDKLTPLPKKLADIMHDYGII